MLRSKALGSAVGIQYQGVQEQSKINVGQGGGVGIIAGYFRRGGQGIFPVTQNDYRERLGHEPLNPFYIAVSDALKFFPIVWVLRLVGGEVIDNGGGTGSGGVISCEGATDSMRFSWFGSDYDVWVDDIYYPSESNPASTIRRELSDILSSADDGFWSVINLDSVPHRIRLVRRSGGEGFDYTVSGNNENQSFMELEDGSLVFCLAPKEEIEDDDCSSTAITFEIFQSWNGMNESGYEKSIKLYDATTNELLGIGEAPIEADNGDYSNILPDLIENLNAGNHQITATPHIDEYGDINGFKLVSRMHRKFRLEVFIGNEGGVSVVPSPDTTMNEVNIDDSAAYNRDAVIVNFCLLPVCVPSEEVLLDGKYSTLLGGHNTLTYKLNEDSIQTFTSSATNLDEFFSQLREHLGFVEETATYRVLDSIAGAGAFKFTNLPSDNGIVLGLISSDKNGLFDVSTTLELIMVGSPNDFVTRFIGESVTLHSCGVLDFQ